MTSNLYYVPSGKTSSLGFASAVGIGLALVLFLSYVYNALIYMMPFIYINFLITTFMGGAVGCTSKFMGRLGKIRNRQHQLYLTLILAISGIYLYWVANMCRLIAGSFDIVIYLKNIFLFLNPAIFFPALADLARVGYWSFFDVTVKGMALWGIWAIEAGIVVGIPLIIYKNHPEIPFSEILHRWYPKYTLSEQFESIAAISGFNIELANDVEGTLEKLSYGRPGRYGEVSVFFLKDESTQYLSVDNIYLEDRGRGKRNVTPVTHLLKIPKPVAEKILARYPHKKNFVIDY